MDRALRYAWLCALVFAFGCGGDGPSVGDDGSLPCDEAACDDGQFCNGEERCDESGCLSGAPPCRDGELCDETADRCEPGCTDDLDGDGSISIACGGDDCDDDDADVGPDATEVCDLEGVDEDCDPSTLAGVDGDADGDGFVATRCCNGDVCGDDCDDTQVNVSPLAPDLCGDTLDNDCDGSVDEGGVLYRDLDNDGRGDPATSIEASCMPGWVANADDCDDGSQITFRGARERCDGRDNDCSLPGDMAGGPDPSEDMDGDLHAPPAAACLSRAELGADALGFEFPKNDCDDAVGTIYGGAEEICGNGVDENCNGTPDDPTSTVFRDADGDGHGTPTESMTITTCEVPSGWSRSSADCDDGRASRFGGALEVCDRIDNDCSTPATIAAVDEDVDGDGFAPIGATCVGAGDAMAPVGAFPRTDCVDDDAATRPGTTEICDGVDRDCSSGGGVAMDEDGDVDGHAPIGAACLGLGEPGAPGSAYSKDDCDDAEPRAYPGVVDDAAVCDGLDNDCTGWAADTGTACAAGGGYCNASGTCGRKAQVVDLSVGGYHTCARFEDGTASCWGANSFGQLGDATTTAKSSPTRVSGIGGVVEISAGDRHTCALLRDGTVRCWGLNSDGQLGDGTLVDRHVPTPVPGLRGVVELSAGADHTCARLSDGTVRCWGNNFRGQLGDGTTTDRSRPTEVPGLSGVVALTAGGAHTCARVGGGAVRCWGDNASGQLGDGTTTNRPSPTTVPSLAGVMELDAGGDSFGGHTCARLGDGTIRCWGSNLAGQLGDGTFVNRSSPTVVPGLSDVVDLSLGSDHSCARLVDGTVRCWGENLSGQLGDGTTLRRSSPTAVPGLGGVIVASAGGDASGGHTCVLLEGGEVRCWGRNAFGQLGDGSTTSRPTPTAVLGPSGVVELGAGDSHTCARMGDGTMRCWGSNFYGQLGDGSTINRVTPTAVPSLVEVTELGLGGSHTCAATRVMGGLGVCWGWNLSGQLGNGTTTNRSTPSVVSGSSEVVELSAGDQHTCARRADGTVRCWGDNTDGQLGDGTGEERTTPIEVPGVIAVELSTGGSHTCARLGDGTVRCWGDNSQGQLGDATNLDRRSPTVVSGLSNVVELGAGLRHTCARLGDGTVRCWGSNNVGQLGDGTMTSRSSPTVVPALSGVVELKVGDQHSCARLADGTARCWGRNTSGELGDGTTITRTSPTAVLDLNDVVELIAGNGHSCARLRDGSIRCWGDNRAGELGDGTVIERHTPTLVWEL